jgi:hypothetical protein
MDASQAGRFMRMMGCARISEGLKWVRSTCPFEKNHSGGVDRSPSFAISISPGDISRCRCLACGVSGDLVALVWRLEQMRKMRRPDLFRFLMKYNQVTTYEAPPASGDLVGQLRNAKKYRPGSSPPPPPRQSNFVHPDDEPQAEVPEDVLRAMIDHLSKAPHVLDYLHRKPDRTLGVKGRQLTDETIAAWEIGWEPRTQRIGIPIRDESGKLVSISGRRFSDKGRGAKYLHSPFKRDRVLYGEHRLDPSIRKGFLLEGFFQVMACDQCGYANPLARMGTHLSSQQKDKLARWFDHLVIVPDGDKAGRESAERIRDDLEHWVAIAPDGTEYRVETIDIVNMMKGEDADSLPPQFLLKILGPLIAA